MIALTRIRTKETIPAKYRGQLKRKADLSLLVAHRACLKDPELKIVFNEDFWKKAKEQLFKESNFKCAYCEANAKVVAHGDVEHYRPKSIYWWLAYTYDNYLFVCQICNQTFKSDNFPKTGNAWQPPVVSSNSTDDEIQGLLNEVSPDPIETESGYTLEKYLENHRLEMASLINPYFEDPEKYFAYEADDVTKEVIVMAAKPAYKRFFEASEKFYGINRIELKTVRYQVYKAFKTLKKALGALPDGEAKQEVEDQLQFMMTDAYLFAGMNRFFNKKL